MPQSKILNPKLIATKSERKAESIADHDIDMTQQGKQHCKVMYVQMIYYNSNYPAIGYQTISVTNKLSYQM